MERPKSECLWLRTTYPQFNSPEISDPRGRSRPDASDVAIGPRLQVPLCLTGSLRCGAGSKLQWAALDIEDGKVVATYLGHRAVKVEDLGERSLDIGQWLGVAANRNATLLLAVSYQT